MTTPNPEDEFLARLGGIVSAAVQQEVQKAEANLRRYHREQLEAELASIKSQFSAQVQDIVNKLSARIDVVEGRVVAGGRGPGGGHVEAAQGETIASRTSQALDIGTTVMKMIREEAMPIFELWQRSKAQSQYSGWLNNPEALAEWRTKNPLAAMVLGQQLAPDNNVTAVLASIPTLTAQAMAAGFQTRIMANQAMAGGGGWPAAPGSASPAYSGAPLQRPGTVNAPSWLHKPGANMQTNAESARGPGSNGSQPRPEKLGAAPAPATGQRLLAALGG